MLGPLVLAVDGAEVEVPGPRRRAVLALLALASGRAVTTDGLLDAVWPDEVPASGRRALHSHVSRLRAHLGPAADRLVRDGDGYRLTLGPGELDADRARALVAHASEAARTDPSAAAGDLAEARALWRGPALAEFADVAPLAAEAVALAELHARVTDDWLEARLAASAGTDSDLLPDAARAAADAPLRERTNALHVRALAGAGRQAEALRAAHAFRQRLADDTGLSPGAPFDALEQEVALGVLAPAAPATRRRAGPAVVAPDRPGARGRHAPPPPGPPPAHVGGRPGRGGQDPPDARGRHHPRRRRVGRRPRPRRGGRGRAGVGGGAGPRARRPGRRPRRPGAGGRRGGPGLRRRAGAPAGDAAGRQLRARGRGRPRPGRVARRRVPAAHGGGHLAGGPGPARRAPAAARPPARAREGRRRPAAAPPPSPPSWPTPGAAAPT